MKTAYERLVIDTYVWVELFAGTGLGVRVKQLLMEAEELYTPCIVLAELTRKYVREGFDEKTVRERLEAVERLSTIVCLDVETAVLVGRAYTRLLENARSRGLKSKPSLADAIILATAWRLNAKVVTGDSHFEGLSEAIMLRGE